LSEEVNKYNDKMKRKLREITTELHDKINLAAEMKNLNS